MDRNKLLQIKEYSNIISEIIDNVLLIKKNKGIKKITQTIDTNVGPNISKKYNIIPEIPEVVPTVENYKIVETIKKAEKAGNWSLVSKLVGLLLSTSSPPVDSKKHQPSIKPLEMQYTSTAGEHNDKYNEQVFNDATIENLTINEVLEEPPVKAMMFDADLKAQKKKLKRTNKPLMFDADLIAQKNKLKPAVVKALMFDADLKAQKKKLKKTKEDKTTAQIEEELTPWWDKKKEKKLKKASKTTAEIENELIPWWDKKKIKTLNIEDDTKKELLDMIETLKNIKIGEIDRTKEKQINKNIEQIEKFINTPEEPKKKEKKTKTVYDPKKIEKNKQLINDYTFNEKMSDRFLTDGAKNLFKLQKNKGTDEDVSEFSIVYLQKEPNADEIEELRDLLKIKIK